MKITTKQYWLGILITWAAVFFSFFMVFVFEYSDISYFFSRLFGALSIIITYILFPIFRILLVLWRVNDAGKGKKFVFFYIIFPPIAWYIAFLPSADSEAQESSARPDFETMTPE